MATTFTKLWHDPVWSKVIATVILAVGATITTYFFNWWPEIGKFVALCFSFALASTPIPNWLIFALGLLALPAVILFGAIGWRTAFPPQSTPPSWKNYTTDFFFNLRWQWKYDPAGQICDTHTFCPHCDFQVYARQVSAFQFVDHIAFHCENCGSHLGEFKESLALLENKTMRFIQLKIRNGTWLTQPAA